MADYTVIVDDHHGQVAYGPSDKAWKLSHLDNTYKGTVHNAMTQDANFAFSFVGGREIIVRGNFNGINNASESTAYPIFQVDSREFLTCSPNPPQNGGQFLCSTPLDSTITNRTLSMFVNPNAAIQQFHIDYIRHGSSPQVAASQNGTVVFVKAPDNTTLGLSFDSNWEYQPTGGTNDITKAMRTSTLSAKATYNFVGDSFAWWTCCLPADITSSNAANVTYSIDRGNPLSVQVDETFIQSTQCEDDKILFQIHGDQIQPGNHTLEVTYGGDDSKIPLTLCGLAAAPLDFSALDVHLLNVTSPSTPPPTITTSPPPSTLTRDMHTAIIAGIICGGVVAFVLVFVSITWWRRKRAKQHRQEIRLSTTDSLSPIALHPMFGLLDTEKRTTTILDPPQASVTVSTSVPTVPLAAAEQDGNSEPQSANTRPSSSPLESRPPSYRTAGSVLDV